LVEAEVAKEPIPPPHGEVQLAAAAVLAPVEAVEREVVAFEPLPGRADVGAAYDRQGRVGHEDELSAGAEQPVRLRYPHVRVAPRGSPVFADGEVEGLVGARHFLGG